MNFVLDYMSVDCCAYVMMVNNEKVVVFGIALRDTFLY